MARQMSNCVSGHSPDIFGITNWNKYEIFGYVLARTGKVRNAYKIFVYVLARTGKVRNAYKIFVRETMLGAYLEIILK